MKELNRVQLEEVNGGCIVEPCPTPLTPLEKLIEMLTK